MPKRATAFELMLPLRERGTPTYRWLYTVLRGEILGGRLRRGARLPATRDLARQYGLSRGTVVSAFQQLKSEGYLQGSVGSGTYVSKVLPDELFRAAREGGLNAPARTKQLRRVSEYGKRVSLFPTFALRPSRAFRRTFRHWICSRQQCGHRSPIDACGVLRRISCSVPIRWDTGRCAKRWPNT